MRRNLYSYNTLHPRSFSLQPGNYRGSFKSPGFELCFERIFFFRYQKLSVPLYQIVSSLEYQSLHTFLHHAFTQA